jgi:GAF domain-containing protein
LQSARSGAFASHSRALDRCVREAIPDLADFCFVHVATARTLRCVAAAHGTPHLTRAMRMLVRGTPIRRDDLVSTVAFVVRTHKPTLRKGIVDDDAAEVRSARAQLHRKLAPRSALVVPLLQDGVALGALSLCYSHSGRSHAARHMPLARRLAVRIAALLTAASNAASRLRAAARQPGQGATARRRLAARN